MRERRGEVVTEKKDKRQRRCANRKIRWCGGDDKEVEEKKRGGGRRGGGDEGAAEERERERRKNKFYPRKNRNN